MILNMCYLRVALSTEIIFTKLKFELNLSVPDL